LGRNLRVPTTSTSINKENQIMKAAIFRGPRSVEVGERRVTAP
jgi:hypothetical protein